jgi:hypothetical protein
MIEFAAAVFITFLVIIDPIGMVPLFAVLTQRRSKELRRRTAIRSISVAAITLLVIAVIGQIVLRFLGIGLPAFRMAGAYYCYCSRSTWYLLAKAGSGPRRMLRPRKRKTAPTWRSFHWRSRLLQGLVL